MKKEKTKLVIEDNAIYEIDLDCVERRKEKDTKSQNLKNSAIHRSGFNKKNRR